MSPKSGRYRTINKGSDAAPPQSLQSNARAQQRMIGLFRRAIPERRFTLDNYYDALVHVTTSIGTAQAMLERFESEGVVVKDGLMHWRRK